MFSPAKCEMMRFSRPDFGTAENSTQPPILREQGGLSGKILKTYLISLNGCPVASYFAHWT
jgi:hypothetical protein